MTRILFVLRHGLARRGAPLFKQGEVIQSLGYAGTGRAGKPNAMRWEDTATQGETHSQVLGQQPEPRGGPVVLPGTREGEAAGHLDCGREMAIAMMNRTSSKAKGKMLWYLPSSPSSLPPALPWVGPTRIQRAAAPQHYGALRKGASKGQGGAECRQASASTVSVGSSWSPNMKNFE